MPIKIYSDRKKHKCILGQYERRIGIYEDILDCKSDIEKALEIVKSDYVLEIILYNHCPICGKEVITKQRKYGLRK